MADLSVRLKADLHICPCDENRELSSTSIWRDIGVPRPTYHSIRSPHIVNEFHGKGKGPAYVTPAIWVNSEDVLDEAQAQSLWDAKILEPVCFLFAGRLVAEKGVKILLEAVEKLAAAVDVARCM